LLEIFKQDKFHHIKNNFIAEIILIIKLKSSPPHPHNDTFIIIEKFINFISKIYIFLFKSEIHSYDKMDIMLALSAIKNAGISISPGTSKSALTFEMLKDVQGFLRAWRRDITLHGRLRTNQ
jgi:hypothetical protein